MDAVGYGLGKRRRIRCGMVMASAAALGLSLAGSDTPWAQAPGRVIHLAAVEMKGGTQQDKEPYPAADLPPGGGYLKTPPNAGGRWEVSTYQWSPATIVAQQGDTVTLEIVGVNGDMHPSTIPGLVESFTVKRGEITRVTFTAGRPGIYPIVCTKHRPSMQGTLVVLPK